MYVCLELRGRYTKLIPYDEKYLDYLYAQLTTKDIEGFEACELKQKSDLYKFMNNSNINIKVFIKNMSNDKIMGYIAGYNYNKIDGYIYVTSILEEQEQLNKEGLNLFIDYLFKCFPIRKIYCEVYEKNNNKLDIIKAMGFREEAVLNEDVFFDGKYKNKYILALYREDYNNG